MTPILQTITAFFTADNWQVENQPDNLSLSMNFQGEHGQWRCYATTRELPPQFVFYSLCPITIPLDRRQDVSEFLTRANYDIVIGNFELDFEDGDVRYKTSIDVEGSQLDSALIKRLVYTNVVMMDQYLPGILAVVYAKASPAEAIAQVEQ